MCKKVLIGGLTGGFTLMIWMIIINGIFGFRSQIDMKKVPNEAEVYETLKTQITVPGRYLCNPQLNSDMMYPAGEPVFSILYGGMGREIAGKQAVFGLLLTFISTIIAAYLLSLTSNKISSSYPRKISFFIIIGLL